MYDDRCYDTRVSAHPRSIGRPPSRRRWFALRRDWFLPATVIFLVALAVRLIHVWQIHDSPFFTVLMGDARGYDDWARQIARGDWLGRDVFYQAPLYPYFLGSVYSVAGPDLMVVRVCQAVIGSLSCVLLGLAGRRLFSSGTGVIAGLILAVYAPAVFFDGLIQKSVLDVFFVCVMLWLIGAFAVGRPRQPLRLWLGLGLAVGALSLTRENALVFAVVLIAFALSGMDRGRRLASAGAFVLGAALVLLPVTVRNQVVGGGVYLTTSQLGPNFYIGNNARADGTYMSLRFGRGAPEYERQDATELAEQALGRRLTPAEVSSYWTDRAWVFIRSQPVAWLNLMGRKLALLWNATEMLDTESQYSYAEWSAPVRLGGWIGHFGVLVPLALFGVWAAWPDRARFRIVLALAGAYAASVALFYVFARYRFPLVPFLVVFAAAGLERARAFFDDRSLARASLALVTVAAAGVFANWSLLSPDLMRAITENNLGAALQADARYDEAVEHYGRATAIQPDYAPAYNNMGSALRAKGRPGDAVAMYDHALRLQPDYPEAHYNAANALLEMGKPNDAIDHFRRALKLAPGSVDAHNNLGIALAQQGNVAGAIAEFRAALAADADSIQAHRNLGDALASLGDRDAAVAELRQAVRLEPGNGAIRYDLGSVLLEAGKMDEAIAELEAALRDSPAAVEIHNNLGIALASQGRIAQAIGHFQEALRIQPGFVDARRNLDAALAATSAPAPRVR